MNIKRTNLIIDILGIIVVLAASYKEFFTEKPMPIWEWVIAASVGFLAIALHTKDIKESFSKWRDKKLES